MKIIQAVIDQRRRKYEENGIFPLFWGVLIMIAGIVQYAMIQMGKGHISGYAWLFTMIPGTIITYISAYREAKKDVKKERTPDMLGWAWAFAGVLALANGFFFGYKFGIGFTFALFIPFCVVAKKSFKNNYPNTEIQLTSRGLEAFGNYVNALKDYIQ